MKEGKGLGPQLDWRARLEVHHGAHIKPAPGYRIDYDGRSVVLSGDTKYSNAVVAHVEGADPIIHEVGAVRPELLADRKCSG